MNINLSDSIKRLRKEKNLTQDDIASMLGVSYQAVSRWETGVSYPDVELLPTLASLFDVSLDTLFCMDEKSKEIKMKQYATEYDELADAEEQIQLTKKYIAELPGNAYLKYRLMSSYKDAGLEYAKSKLNEMRKLCQFVVDHAADAWYRNAAIDVMISVEDDDNVETWIFMLDNRTFISSSNALTHRYFYRNEIDKYNTAIQRDIVCSLSAIFMANFCKRDVRTYKSAESRVFGQRKVLEIIDIMRNPKIECDAWIDSRAFAYLRLAGGCFGIGKIEEGYAALEKAVDLYVMLANLTDGTVLQYNCSSLDLLTEKFDRNRIRNNINDAYRCLTVPDGWEWFNCVRNEERYQKQVERIKQYCSENTIEL